MAKATKVKTGNAVEYMLEKMGQTAVGDALRRFERALGEHGFVIAPTLTVKPGEMKLALAITQAEDTDLPLFQIADGNQAELDEEGE